MEPLMRLEVFYVELQQTGAWMRIVPRQEMAWALVQVSGETGLGTTKRLVWAEEGSGTCGLGSYEGRWHLIQGALGSH